MTATAGLPDTHIQILRLVAQAPGKCPKEIAGPEGPAITRTALILDKLRVLGYVERKGGANYSLTEKGRAAIATVSRFTEETAQEAAPC